MKKDQSLLVLEEDVAREYSAIKVVVSVCKLFGFSLHLSAER